MRKFFEKLKNNQLLLDGMNVALGVVLLVSLIVFMASRVWLALLAAVWAAGLINMVNGLKAMRKKTGVFGQSMLFMGALIIIGGTVLVLSAMGLWEH